MFCFNFFSLLIEARLLIGGIYAFVIEWSLKSFRSNIKEGQIDKCLQYTYQKARILIFTLFEQHITYILKSHISPDHDKTGQRKSLPLPSQLTFLHNKFKMLNLGVY